MVRRQAQWRLGWAVVMMAAVALGSIGLVHAGQRRKLKPAAKPAPKAAKPAPAPAPAQPAVTSGGVEIISPESEAKIRGVATVRVAWPNAKGYVVFRVDDRFLFASTGPYMMKWDTSNLPDGEHVLSVDGFDGQGNFEGSSSIKVTVQNTIPTPENGVLLAVRFGSEDMLNRVVNARAELSAMTAEEALPTGYESLAGSLKGNLTQTVMDPFYQGTSVLLRNRLKDGWLTVSNVRSTLPDVGQYAMVQVSRNGLVIPSVTAVRRTRIPFGEVSLALADYPVYSGDTWQSPLGAVVDLYSRRTIYVQAQHTFEGLRWYNGRECAMVTSIYSIPTVTLYEVGRAQAGLSGTAGYSLQLTQMRSGMGGRGGGGGGRGGGRRGGTAGAAAATRGAARAGAGQAGRGAAAQGQLQSVKLVDLQGQRVTYLARRSGRVIHTEDTVKGRIEFRTAGATSSARALTGGYAVELTQMRGGMGGRGGGMGGGGGGRGGARAAGRAAAAQAGGAGRSGRAAQPATAGQRPAGPTRYPASLDYGFRLSTELVAK